MDYDNLHTLSVLVSSLNVGDSYSFRMRAVTEVGEGESTDFVSNIPAARPAFASGTLLTVSQKNISGGGGQLELSWPDANSNGSPIIRYEYRQRISGSWTSWLSVGFVRTFLVNGLDNGVDYDFQVRAVNAIGNGLAIIRENTKPASRPSAPQDFTVRRTSQNNLLELRWSAPSENGGSSINQYQYKKGNGNWINAGGENVFSKVVISLNPGQEYTFQIRVRNVDLRWSLPTESLTLAPGLEPGAFTLTAARP